MKLETRIMKEIKDKKVQMKPGWWFEAIRRTETSGVIVLILLGGGLLAAIEYFVELLSPGELMVFGDIGRQVILENLPYQLIMSAVIVVIAAGAIYSRTGDNYKNTRIKSAIKMGITLLLITELLILIRTVSESL